VLAMLAGAELPAPPPIGASHTHSADWFSPELDEALFPPVRERAGRFPKPDT